MATVSVEARSIFWAWMVSRIVCSNCSGTGSWRDDHGFYVYCGRCDGVGSDFEQEGVHLERVAHRMKASGVPSQFPGTPF